MYDKEEIGYDELYDFMEGWLAYAQHANTYKLRHKIIAEFEQKFSSEISNKEVNRAMPPRVAQTTVEQRRVRSSPS